MTFEIRSATPVDAEAVREVARESWHAAYDDLLGADSVDSVVDEWYDPEGLTRSMDHDGGVFLVAERGNEDGLVGERKNEDAVVGFAQGVLDSEADDSIAELPRIYVHPNLWGAGLGTELLGRVEDWADECGAERLRLVVLADNDVGNGFYEKHGYRVNISREVELEGENVTEYVREKEL